MGVGGARCAASASRTALAPAALRQFRLRTRPAPAPPPHPHCPVFNPLCEDNAVMGVLLYHGGEQ